MFLRSLGTPISASTTEYVSIWVQVLDTHWLPSSYCHATGLAYSSYQGIKGAGGGSKRTKIEVARGAAGAGRDEISDRG